MSIRLFKLSFLLFFVSACGYESFSPKCSVEINIKNRSEREIINAFESTAKYFKLDYEGSDREFPNAKDTTMAFINYVKKPVLSIIEMPQSGVYTVSIYQNDDDLNLEKIVSKINEILTIDIDFNNNCY